MPDTPSTPKDDFSSLDPRDFQVSCDTLACPVVPDHDAKWIVTLECGCIEFWCGTRFSTYSSNLREHSEGYVCDSCVSSTVVKTWVGCNVHPDDVPERKDYT
jgi:hypothetical protein